jgi:hypothetical protein
MREIIAILTLVLVVCSLSSPSMACKKIHVCDFTQTPPCHDSCPDLFVSKSNGAYALTFKRLDPKAASAFLNQLGGVGSAKATGSSLTIKGLAKTDIPQIFDKLNIDRDTVHVPQ